MHSCAPWTAKSIKFGFVMCFSGKGAENRLDPMVMNKWHERRSGISCVDGLEFHNDNAIVQTKNLERFPEGCFPNDGRIYLKVDSVDDCEGNPCGNQGQCTDQINDFTCTSCDAGFILANRKCIEIIDCDSGYEFVDGKCVDIDDCLLAPCGAESATTCTDKLNDYECSACNSDDVLYENKCHSCGCEFDCSVSGEAARGYECQCSWEAGYIFFINHCQSKIVKDIHQL
ncbi:uncharacterized protein LOC141914257 [Tubulanus polymorphus]|uniref:uncharacterized protein LOC141914257 n=1 Tax=Tubulanus polymorphus TaxID=672921 RepID=UPI003DA3CAD9